jgi:very-short-patch-repair endonuclease
LALPPETIATGVTGLQLFGVGVGPQLPMTFATTHPRQVRRRDVKVMRLKELPAHQDGVADPEPCWLAAALTLNLLDLVTAGDSLLRLRRMTLVRLQSAVQTHSGRGIVAARTAVRLIREQVDSPRETWLRLCLVLAGLPMPQCNLIIGDDQGPIGRVDLVYLAYGLIIEYEGDQHRTDRNQWNRDIDRHEDFAGDNWTLIRVTSERARWPRQVVRSVYKALRANGYDGPAPEFGELWISLFESRAQ